MHMQTAGRSTAAASAHEATGAAACRGSNDDAHCRLVWNNSLTLDPEDGRIVWRGWNVEEGYLVGGDGWREQRVRNPAKKPP